MLNISLAESSYHFSNEINYPNGVLEKVNQLSLDGGGVSSELKKTSDLPKLATANDIREVVSFFRGNDSNITLLDFLSLEPRRVFEKRKVEAYLYWGIICLENDYIRLTEFGSELAKKIELERNFYRQILFSNKPYLSAIEWICEQNSKIINYQKLIFFWQQFFSTNIEGVINRDHESIASSFFSLCHAAEFGKLIIGKRGQPTRLIVNSKEIQEFLNPLPHSTDALLSIDCLKSQPTYLSKKEKRKVYLSCKESDKIVELLELLELTDFDSILMQEFKTVNGFSTPDCLTVMQKCEVGIILLDSINCKKKNGKNIVLEDESLVEINTALALFSQKVVLCWNCSNSPPPEIEKTNLTVIKSNELDWATNIEVLKRLKGFV